jgi:hypothetical protein
MMLPNDLVFRLRKRAEIRRQITTRKSVQNNEPDRISELLEEAATMLRQQHAEIEALRNQLWDLKSEPWGFDRHPVKELTDEEIRHIQAICHLKDVGYDNFIMRFARAILRKAQEK